MNEELFLRNSISRFQKMQARVDKKAKSFKHPRFVRAKNYWIGVSAGYGFAIASLEFRLLVLEK